MQVSADADGTRTTVPHAQSTIALYTELDVECDQQSADVVNCTPDFPRWPVAARCCQQHTDRCRCLYRTRRR